MPFVRYCNVSVLAVAIFILTACGTARNSEAAPEIEMKAGKYELGFSGRMMGFSSSNLAPGKNDCLNEGQEIENITPETRCH